jgi:hypothetical protein
MLLSFIVYGILGLSLWVLGSVASQREKINKINSLKTPFLSWEILLSLLIFAIISGIRWNVGTDHLSYLSEYQSITKLRNDFFDFEYGFYLITYLLSIQNIHFSIYFGLLAFLQLFFVYYAFKNDRYILIFLGLIIVFGGQYHLWMNGIRQSIAACIFVFSIQFIVSKSFIRYFATILLAVSFHKSALILIILYFIPNKNYFKNRIITILLLISSIIIGLLSSVWLQKINSFDRIISIIGYDNYASKLDYFISEMRIEMGFGPRRILTNLINIIHIIYFQQIYNIRKDKKFLLFFNLSIIGALYFNSFSNSGYLFLRPSYYFLIFTPIITAYILYYLYNKSYKGYSIKFLLLLILSISYLIIAIVADSTNNNLTYTNFKFFWDYF